jgi:hypothetical protein
MYLLRKSWLPVVLAGALFAAAPHAAQTSEPGMGQGSVFPLAALPLRAGLQRRMHSAKRRVIAWWLRRAPGAAVTGCPAAATIRPQRSSAGTSARGPPRFR